MNSKKTKCPLCMTKMKEENHVKICPSCGYRLCDHNYDATSDHYNNTDHTHDQKVTYSTQKTSYTNHTSSTPPSSSGDYTNRSGSTTNNTTNTGNSNYSSNGTTAQNNTSTVHTMGKKTNSTSAQASAVKKLSTFIFVIGLSIVISSSGMFYTIKKLFLDKERPIFDDVDWNSPEFSEDFIDYTDEPSVNPRTIITVSDDGTLIENFIKEAFHTDGLCTQDDVNYLYLSESAGKLCIDYATKSGDFETVKLEYQSFNPKDLSYFPNMNYLYLGQISLREHDLDGLNQLYNLSCGNSPAELSTIVPSPEQLLYLDTDLRDDVENLKGIETFSSLNTYCVNGTNLKDASAIASLPNLCELMVYSNNLENFDFLYQLPNLNSLYIYSDQLTDISFLKNMSSLSVFTTIYGSYSDLSPLENCPQLYSLTISENPELSDCRPLSVLKDLQLLDISSCNISDLSFASELSNLSSLNICHNPVTDLSPLTNLNALTSVHCYDTDITDDGGLDSSILYR